MKRFLLTTGAFLAVGCSGALTAPSGDGTVPLGEGPVTLAACQKAPITAAAAQLRRLSSEQELNSVRDLLADPAAAPAYVSHSGGIITEREVEGMALAAQELISRKGHVRYAPCKTDGAHDLACAEGFIRAFGKAAFRRPVEESEVEVLLTTYKKARDTAGVSPAVTFSESLGVVAQVILQSPSHVYVVERGVPDDSLPESVRKLDGFERASRLSYLFWNTTPDAALLSAAESGALDTPEGMRAAASRLLDDPRAQQALRRFASRWLELDGTQKHDALEGVPKEATRFPQDSATLRQAMREELVSLYAYSFGQPGDAFQTLMTSSRAYVNKSLAGLYGVKNGPTSDTQFQWVDLNKDQRSGLFTRAGFLALQASNEFSSPIRRGVFLYRNVLCESLDNPPPTVDDTPIKPGVTGGPMTVRALTHERTRGASCVGCHDRVNPLGYTLENFDALGAWKSGDVVKDGSQDVTLPVDVTATVDAGDLQATLAGGNALAARLGQSQRARDCHVSKWFEQAFDRKPVREEACSVLKVQEQFRADGDLRSLLLTLASSDAALYIGEAQP